MTDTGTKPRGRAVGEEGNQTNDVDEESQSYGLTAEWAANERTNVQLRGYFSRFDEITRGVCEPAQHFPTAIYLNESAYLTEM